jgi:hypothetical protein
MKKRRGAHAEWAFTDVDELCFLRMLYLITRIQKADIRTKRHLTVYTGHATCLLWKFRSQETHNRFTRL